MFDLSKYIHIPYKSHGRDFDGCDCYGLVRLVLKEEFGKELPDFWDYTSAEDGTSVQEIILEGTPLVNAERKEKPEIGDIVLFTFRGYTSHMGLYVGNNMILHVIKNIDSCCVPINSGMLKGRIEGFYGIK